MSFSRVGISLVGLIALVATTLSAATIWLFVTDPVTVVDAVGEQDVTPVVRELASIIFEALKGILRYL